MTIKALLFDIDGTLVDSNDLHVLAREGAFAGVGALFDRQVLHDQVGKGTDMLVPTLLPDLDKEAQEGLGEAQDAIFKTRYLHQAKPFTRAHDLFAHAHANGQKVVLASSASKGELEHYLDLLDARDLVDVTVTAADDDVAKTKPAPDIFAVALDRLNDLSAGEVMAVGNTPYDVEAAAKCGVTAVALRSGGFADEALAGAGAIAIYDDVAALLAEYSNSAPGRLM